MGNTLGIAVLVVDDHAIVREGWKQILNQTPDIRVAGEAADADEALALVQSRPWDAVVLDITMPGRSGIELLRDIKRLKPDLRVLMVSLHSEEEYARRLFRDGASGFLNKHAAPDELVQAVRKVVAGGRYVSSTLAELLAFALDDKGQEEPHHRLSANEYRVFRLIAEGMTTNEIAEALCISPKTVSTYRCRILEKTGLKSDADIVRYALKHAIVE